jgi:hypothetical protein
MFQGGVAANAGMRESFEKYLEHEIIIPEHYDVMGAIGAAILAKEEMNKRPRNSTFYGWDIPEMEFKTTGFECDGCPNICEIVEIHKNDQLVARWGSRCGKWDLTDEEAEFI